MTRATCEEKDATFVNNDLNFTYRDGSCDEAAFVKDSINLSAHGLTKLLSNISLYQPQQLPTSRTTKNRPPSSQGPPPKIPRDAGGDGQRNVSAASTARRTGRAATIPYNLHGRLLASAENAAKPATSQRSVDRTMP